MSKKSSSSLNRRLSEQGELFVRKFDTALNHGALAILQSLVFAGEKLTIAWCESAERIESRFHALVNEESYLRVQKYFVRRRDSLIQVGNIIKDPAALAKTVDAGLYQSAFFILQQLVNTGDFATRAWMYGNLHMLPIYAALSRNLKRKFARLALKQFAKPDFKNIFGNIADRESLLKAIDQVLQAVAYTIIQSLIVFCIQVGCFLKFALGQLVDLISHCQRSFVWKLCKHLNQDLSLIHISEPTRRTPISYAVFCLKKRSFFNDTATTEIYTRLVVGSVRCV